MGATFEEFEEETENKSILRFVTVGSVDDGKSTLIGRLLHDTSSVYDDQLKAVASASRENVAEGEIDFALLTDGLKAEREQGITIDVAYRYFSTKKRKFIIADTPGHVQYTRNMATGASTADVALILIDSRYGVLPQSKRHAYIASLLGIRYLLVCVNKMDLKNYDQKVYDDICSDFSQFAATLNFTGIRFIPVSALKGSNIVSKSSSTGWYDGPTVLEYLENVNLPSDDSLSHFCFPVQYVLRPDLNFRGFAGRIASGLIRKGETIRILPSGKTTKIKTIVTYDGELAEAFSPMSVALTLNEEIDVSRGDILTHPDTNVQVSRQVKAHLVWMDEKPMIIGRQYFIKHTTSLISGVVSQLHHLVNIETLQPEPAKSLQLNEIGLATITLARPIVAMKYNENRQMGAFILIDRLSNMTAAAGMIFETSENQSKEKDSQPVTAQERALRFSQQPAFIYFSGNKKKEDKIKFIKMIERLLFEAGHFALYAENSDLTSTLLSAGMIVLSIVEFSSSDFMRLEFNLDAKVSADTVIKKMTNEGILI